MTKRYLLSAINIDGGTQPRERIDQNIVAEYCDAMIDGAKFPPVVVFSDGSDHWLADGFHRYHAANKAGLKSIEADTRKGTQRDAILHSVGTNAGHGLRRTNDDKRRAVETLLRDDEWAKWSNREIARKCAVDHTFVGKLRKNTTGVKHQSTPRKGADGRTINTSNIGKSRQSETTEEIIDTKTGKVLVLEGAAVMTTKVQKYKHTETHEVSDAMHFAEIAIAHLTGIHPDDPKRGEALRCVAAWISHTLGA